VSTDAPHLPVLILISIRSNTLSNTLNPNWEHTFVLSTLDGLHEAAYVQLLIKDESRSGEDRLMGVVYIPKEEFYTANAVRGTFLFLH
jgi:hypothetical protein